MAPGNFFVSLSSSGLVHGSGLIGALGAAGGLGAAGLAGEAGLGGVAVKGLAGSPAVASPPAGGFGGGSAFGLNWHRRSHLRILEPGFQPLRPPGADHFFRLPWTYCDCGENALTAVKR